MIDISLSEKQKFEVTVNKAHKILGILKKYETSKKEDLKIQDYSTYADNSINMFSINYATIISNSEDELKLIMNNQIEKKMEKFISAIEVLEDIQSLKEEIFSFNVSNSISKRLNFIEKKKNIIKLYELYNFKSTSDKQTVSSIVQNFKKLNNTEFERNEEFEFEFMYWNNDNIKKELKNIKSKILEYEDEILSLNGTKKISFSLYKSSIELIGL
jgi:hypothetical protein